MKEPCTVKWRDSRMYITQEDSDTNWEICVIESCGFLIEEGDGYVVLAGDLVDSDVRRTLVIPTENIIEIK